MKLGRLEIRFAGAKSGVQNPSQWLMDWLGAGKSSTGIDVQETTAMQAMAVYACVKVLSETIATLPLPVYRNLATGGKERAPSHPLYRILHDAPNPEMTSSDFRATMMTHLLLWGNAYAEIERDGAGRPIALWPLRPDRMQIWRGLEVPYQLEYWYSLYTGGMAVLAPEQVLHIKNLSIDGIRGLSPIAHQREAVGLALALESFAGHYFGNDASPGGFLSAAGKLSDDARKRLKAAWESSHRGLDNSHRMAVLEEGITFQKIGIPPNDSQFLESRGFQLAEIARMYRVPLHLIGDMGRVTHANIEHMGIDFVTHTIRPHVVNWEQAIAQKLFFQSESQSYFAEFVVDALLRGDLASRYAAYATGRQWGFLNVDEIRDKENLNPLPDGAGQEYLSPLNMTQFTTPTVPGPDSAPGKDETTMEDQTNRSSDWQRWFGSEIAKVIRIEQERVLQNAEKTLKKGNIRAFQAFLSDFYTEKLPPMVQERVGEVFGNGADTAKDYVANLSERHAQEHLKALQAALLVPDTDPLSQIQAVTSSWNALEVVKSERYALMLRESAQPTPSAEERMASLVETMTRSFSETLRATVEAIREAYQPQVPPTYTFNGPPITVNVPAQEAPVTNVEVHPAAVTVQPELTFPITVEPAPPATVNIDQPINITTPEVPVNVTVEGDTITNQVQQPDVTILPAENVINVNIPPTEPSRGVQILRDGAGNVIGTAPRSLPKPEEPKKPKAKK